MHVNPAECCVSHPEQLICEVSHNPIPLSSKIVTCYNTQVHPSSYKCFARWVTRSSNGLVLFAPHRSFGEALHCTVSGCRSIRAWLRPDLLSYSEMLISAEEFIKQHHHNPKWFLAACTEALKKPAAPKTSRLPKDVFGQPIARRVK